FRAGTARRDLAHYQGSAERGHAIDPSGLLGGTPTRSRSSTRSASERSAAARSDGEATGRVTRRPPILPRRGRGRAPTAPRAYTPRTAGRGSWRMSRRYTETPADRSGTGARESRRPAGTAGGAGSCRGHSHSNWGIFLTHFQRGKRKKSPQSPQ